MARPRQGVTLENSNKVYFFFEDVLLDGERIEKILISNDYFFVKEAKDNFQKISQLKYCSLYEYEICVSKLIKTPDSRIAKQMFKHAKEAKLIKDPEQLDKWVLKYITKKGWSQCLNNIRQSEYSKKTRYQIKQIKINHKIKDQLDKLCLEEDLSINNLLNKLICSYQKK